MRFAKFAGEDGKPVYINPALVETIRELNDRLCLSPIWCGRTELGALGHAAFAVFATLLLIASLI